MQKQNELKQEDVPPEKPKVSAETELMEKSAGKKKNFLSSAFGAVSGLFKQDSKEKQVE